jgi:hypothetical protein
MCLWCIRGVSAAPTPTRALQAARRAPPPAARRPSWGRASGCSGWVRSLVPTRMTTAAGRRRSGPSPCSSRQARFREVSPAGRAAVGAGAAGAGRRPRDAPAGRWRAPGGKDFALAAGRKHPCAQGRVPAKVWQGKRRADRRWRRRRRAGGRSAWRTRRARDGICRTARP